MLERTSPRLHMPRGFCASRCAVFWYGLEASRKGEELDFDDTPTALFDI